MSEVAFDASAKRDHCSAEKIDYEGCMSKYIDQFLKLSDVGTVARGKSKHRPRNDPSLYNGEYPFIQTGDVKHSSLYVTEYSQTYNKISKRDHTNISKRSGLEVGDIIFSNIGTLGSMAIFTGDIEYSVKNVLIFKLFNERQSIFLYHMLKEGYVLDQLLASCSGASQQFISLRVARGFQVFDPGMLLINKFGRFVFPLHEQKTSLRKANEKLRQTRDRLLTRLISGKLSVEDLDIQFPPSMTDAP